MRGFASRSDLLAWIVAAVTAIAPVATGQDAAPATDLGGRVQAALDKARPALLAQAAEARSGHLALLCLAMVHDRVPPTDEVFAKAMARLRDERLVGTYSVAIRLMVLAAFPDFPDRAAVAKADTRTLLACQHRDGGFCYQPGQDRWDLSNTQYAALGMRAAISLGCEVPQSSWKGMLAATRRLQSPNGGFGYSRRNKGPYASMTVAGIAVLHLCQQHTQADGRGRKPSAEDIGKRLNAAWKWMVKHRGEIGQRAGHTFYFHYGVERAAILSGLETIGDVDWYRTGAEFLLGLQTGKGGWSRAAVYDVKLDAADPVSTSFAVLFLRRSFQRVLKPTLTIGGGLLTRGLPEDATPAQVARAVELDVHRGLGAVPDLLKAMRSPILPRRKAAALALMKISGKDFGYHPYRDPAKSTEAIEAAERWWMVEGRKKKG